MRWAVLFNGTLASLVVAACGTPQPVEPTPEAFTALHVVNNGPFPLYAAYADRVATRPAGVPLNVVEKQTIDSGRIARAQNRVRIDDDAWLLKGCIFDVESTAPDQQETSYVWAYGHVVRCDELLTDGVVEPQMGIRPNKLRVYDGHFGYFPMNLLDSYTGSAPAPRH